MASVFCGSGDGSVEGGHQGHGPRGSHELHSGASRGFRTQGLGSILECLQFLQSARLASGQ